MDSQLQKRLDLAHCMGRYFAGMASEKECRRLDEWLEESPEHRDELEKIRQEVKKGRPECPEISGMWTEFEHRIGYRRNRWKQLFRYAALWIIPLFLSMWLYFGERSEIPEPAGKSITEITPGKLKARLVLADGKVLDLDKDTELDIRENENTWITTDGNILQYETGANKKTTVGNVYNTLIVPAGGEFSLRLSDGSRVWLNAGSKLKYPVVFTGELREVEMEGEGYFEVEHKKDIPFVVKVNGMSVRVLGTSFNISEYKGEVVTTLISGKVSLSKGQNNIVLNPGEQAVLETGQSDFKVQKVNAWNYTLWKEGIFWFENTRLETILEQLARWYDVEVFYTNPELKELYFSVEMKRYDDIKTVLRKIEYTQKMHFNITGRTIVVSK